MNQLLPATSDFLRDDAGITAIEYALIAATIAIAVVVTVVVLGQTVHDFYLRLKDCFDNPSAC